MRAFGTNTTEEQRTADPQRKGPKDADEAFDEEVGNQTVFAAVGLEPCIAHSKHAKQEGQPVEPALGLGGGRGFANAFLDFELDELARTAASEEQRQPEGGDGGEERGTDAQGRVDVKVAGSEFHEPDRRKDDGHGQKRQQVANEPRHRGHDEEFQQHHALQALTVGADDPVNADLATALLEGEHEPVNQHGNGEKDDGDHDDVIENLNQTEEDVEEQNGPADDVRVVQLDLFVGVGAVLHLRAQILKPLGCIGGRRGGQFTAVDGHAEVHVIVVHQRRSLRFFHHGPRGENGVERQGWVAKGPRFVDAHHGEVFHGHWHAAVHHLVVLNRDFTGAVVLRDRSLENRGLVHHVHEGDRLQRVADVGLGFAGDG